MMYYPTMRRDSWLPEVFNDLFNSDFMPKANATAQAINVLEDDKEYTYEYYYPTDRAGFSPNQFNPTDGNAGSQRGRR